MAKIRIAIVGAGNCASSLIQGIEFYRHAKGTGGKDHDGLGEGVLRIYADAQGKVAGFSWSMQAASQFQDPKNEHLVIGRLKPGFKP